MDEFQGFASLQKSVESKGPPATFLGQRPPSYFTSLSTIIDNKSFSKNLRKKLLQFIVRYITDNDSVDQEQWDRFVAVIYESDQFDLQREDIATLFSGLLMVFKTAIKKRVQESVFVSDLVKLGINEDHAVDFSRFLNIARGVVEDSTRITFPKLDTLNWRVDVTISTSELSRVLKPTILMSMVDSNGDVRTFEMTPEAFHKLRFSVARVLREFSVLEQNPILKIDKGQ